MRLKGECTSHTRTDVRVRDQKLVVDEPVERGGTNQGPTPTEVMLSSLVACTNVITHKIAKKHGIPIADMAVEVSAQFDRHGVTLQEEIDVPFPKIDLHIQLTTDADEAAIETLKSELAQFCPVSKVIRQAGTLINEHWTIVRPC
jgi:uncharacterized OsmC-like protein